MSAILTGSTGAETLNGSSLGDTIDGKGGGDTVHAGAGDDTILIEAAESQTGATYDGGSGTDTLSLTLRGTPAENKYGPIFQFALFNDTLTSIERIVFNSTADQGQSALVFYGGLFPNQLDGTALSTSLELVGSDGMDTFALVALSSGTFDLPSTITRTNWTDPVAAWLPNTGDSVAFVGLGAFSYTVNASTGHAGLESLITNDGNDLLIGSDGAEYLDAGAGSNTVQAGGGDDAIVFINAIAPSPGVATPTTVTGATSTYDGGDGTDYVLVGGHVTFSGTLQNMEGIYFEPAFTPADPATATAMIQPDAVFAISSTRIMGQLPADLILDGTGTLQVDLDGTSSFDGSGYVHAAGSAVNVVIQGSARGDTGTGTDGDDTFRLSAGADTLRGAAGNDTFVTTNPFVIGQTLDGGDGFDTIEVVEGVQIGTTLAGLPEYIGFFSGNALSSIEGARFDSTPGHTVILLIEEASRAAAGLVDLTGGGGQDIMITTLDSAGTYTMADFVLHDWSNDLTDPEYDAVSLTMSGSGAVTLNAREGLASVQYLGGGGGNDTLNGSSGSDILEGGAGTNALHAGAGDDRLVVQNIPYAGPGVIGPQDSADAGSVYDGGEGTDALYITGSVQFDAALSGIEQFQFEVNDAAQPTHITIGAAQLAANEAALTLTGTGSMTVQLGEDDLYDAGTLTHGDGSEVRVTVAGTVGDEIVSGSSGFDAVAAGDGIDTVAYSAPFDSYSVVHLGRGTWSVTDLNGETGTDYLTGVELLEFGDLTVDESDTTGGRIDGTDDADVLSALNSGSWDIHAGLGDDTVYGGLGDDSIDGGQGGDDMLLGGEGNDTLWTYDNVIDPALSDGSPVYSYAFHDMLVGGLGQDAFFLRGDVDARGNDDNDRFVIETVKGTVSGGAGTDSASFDFMREALYSGVDAGVTVNLAPLWTGGTGTVTGAAGTLRLTGIEALDAENSLVGTDFADKVTIGAYAGAVVADLLDGADTYSGGAGADMVLAGSGNDTVTGGGGNDTLDGQDGIDTVSYATAGAAVRVDLSLDSIAQATGGAGTDTLSGFENLTGSKFADTLGGDDGANAILGGDGNDTLEGQGGADVLNGGGGIDTASYARAGAAVTVNLLTGKSAGADGIDTLTAIENVTGSAFADTLIGNAGANTLTGGDGADKLTGGDGADKLVGGAGIDTAIYATAGAAVIVNLATGIASGGAGADTLTAIENVTGSAFADTLTGNAGINRIVGGGGKDTIATGMGNDVIAYLAVADSAGTRADLIKDFAGAGVIGGDRIDLSAIDATAGGLDNAFVFGGTTARAHGVWFARDAGAGVTHVYVDTDGVTGTAEMTIDLTGLLTLNAGDFVL